MKTYWDSSALVAAVWEPGLKARLQRERGLTRPHALAETFSALTGNPETRIDADSAAAVVKNLSASLAFIDLSAGNYWSFGKRQKVGGSRGAGT